MTITEYMQETGTKLTDLAARLGVSPSRLHDWKSGRRLPRAESLAKIEAVTAGAVRAADFVHPAPAEVAQ